MNTLGDLWAQRCGWTRTAPWRLHLDCYQCGRPPWWKRPRTDKSHLDVLCEPCMEDEYENAVEDAEEQELWPPTMSCH